MHIKSGINKPFIEGGPRFYSNANKKGWVFIALMYIGFSGEWKSFLFAKKKNNNNNLSLNIKVEYDL